MRPRRATTIAALALSWALVGCGSSAPEPIYGVRLGMTPPQVRERFSPAAGTFRSESMGEDLALVWEPTAPRSPVREARHEFHLGQLVAMRLTLEASSPSAQGEDIVLTGVSVLTRERAETGVALTWLARSCPTHADEVRRRIEQHR